jgi:peptide deformylase
MLFLIYYNIHTIIIVVWHSPRGVDRPVAGPQEVLSLSVRSIVLYESDPETLRRVSEPVTELGPETTALIRDLKDTLGAHPSGIGLAAPQIGVHRRVVLVCRGAGEGGGRIEAPIALVNPELLEANDERPDHDGCLSFPGLYGRTIRPHHLVVKGLDEAGAGVEWSFEGFDAVVAHHEMDHLDGILFIDRIRSPRDLYRD